MFYLYFQHALFEHFVTFYINYFNHKGKKSGFPGGAVVESPPADAGDTVHAPVREGPTCGGAAGPVSHGH